MKSRVEPEVSPHLIDVQVDEQFQVRVQPDLLHRAALATLVHQRVEEPYELAVVLTGDEQLHKLNLRHRGVDAPTDVLAFPGGGEGGASVPFVSAPVIPRYLGDVVISFQCAEAQAAETGHGVQAELQLLTIHGVLHLLGHDDVEEEQRAQMWAAQAEILQALGVAAHPPA
ncbi:MAG: rRNA maturation RNase YbeY [Chloroflexota bacterium]|nr:rRNA maturation RNase YbeY [Chloroflexota bacterium]